MSQAGAAGSTLAAGVRRIELSIGGMACAACAARVEKTLAAIPDVTAAVNFATEKANVAAPVSVSVEHLIDVVRRAGYSAEATRPVNAAEDADGPGDGADDRTALLRRRLIVALIFFIPLSDLSVQLSLFPAFRFTGWQCLRRNLAWAFGYNAAAAPLAACGLLNPLIAGAAMAASSAFVVASSVRLRLHGENAAASNAATGFGGPEQEACACPG